ncbi:ATP-grasp domain-containing protein [Priestia endophytica]|uniref:ATP-grasp domain-containing protein n=1 Tax=Priestia endophytica TaxID=135735 RepID=UPI000DCA6578|nr:ATP-grasp domain-containing protein [Priestia endophytica]RAS77460.1 hypothetical protein A4R27_18720 [Priestia endophytica]
MTILIINPDNDLHCLHMIKRMKERSIAFFELESQSQNNYSFVDGQLIYNNVPVEQFNSVFYRNKSNFIPISLGDTYFDSFNDNRLLESHLENLNSWISIISNNGGRIINPPMVRSKFMQIHQLKKYGIPMPETCITNSPIIIREFVKKVKKAVYKPISGGFYCRRITQKFLDTMDTFIREPAIYQEEIIGKDIRVNLLNNRVLSAHLIKMKDKDILDYRMDPDYKSGNINYEKIKLPPHVIKFCIKASEILNLTFTGIDLKVDSKGQYYLIECNSMPSYLDIEFKTDTPITDYIIDYLHMGNDNNVSDLKRNSYKDYMDKYGDIVKGNYLFNYKEVLLNYAENNGQIIRIPLNEVQKQTFYNCKITDPESIIVMVDKTGCQLIGVE